MNIQVPFRIEQSLRPLEGRASLETGSTNGIGLTITGTALPVDEGWTAH